jgi:RNA recognition motif-containing protein
MTNKVYVGNLSFNMQEQGLQDLFARFGSVSSAKIITDRDTGRSKGFAFVEMSSGAEAQAAIDALDGKDHEGRALKVSLAKPMAPKDNKPSFRSSRY